MNGMNRADIEAEIGIPPGDASFLLDKSTAPLVRQWLTTFGWSVDRANAARHSTLERIYRFPRELDYFRRRGEYNTNLRGKEWTAAITTTANARENCGPAEPAANSSAKPITIAQTKARTSNASPVSENDMRSNATLTDTIAGIVCGEFSDDDVLSLFRACKAHLGV